MIPRGWFNDLQNNEAARQAFHQGEWNTFRIQCQGGSIKTWLNEVPAADLRDDRVRSGFIGLQVHGVAAKETPMEVRFRHIRLQELRPVVEWPMTDDPRRRKSEARMRKGALVCSVPVRRSNFEIPSDFVIRYSGLRIAVRGKPPFLFLKGRFGTMNRPGQIRVAYATRIPPS